MCCIDTAVTNYDLEITYEEAAKMLIIAGELIWNDEKDRPDEGEL